MSSVNPTDQFVGAIDQGTSSTRFLIFNVKTQEVVASNQACWSKRKTKIVNLGHVKVTWGHI